MKRIALLTLLLAGCAGPGESAVQTGEASEPAQEVQTVKSPQEAGRTPTDVTFAPALGVDLEAMSLQESGLYIQVLREGEGPLTAPGSEMGVHYTVWVSDGTKLDSSFDHRPPEPLAMTLGKTALVDGWVEGVTGMRLGEKRLLVVPYQLGYGARGRPPQLPGYATLVFEVELAEHMPAD